MQSDSKRLVERKLAAARRNLNEALKLARDVAWKDDERELKARAEQAERRLERCNEDREEDEAVVQYERERRQQAERRLAACREALLEIAHRAEYPERNPTIAGFARRTLAAIEKEQEHG